jgi:hypothetical protein
MAWVPPVLRINKLGGNKMNSQYLYASKQTSTKATDANAASKAEPQTGGPKRRLRAISLHSAILVAIFSVAAIFQTPAASAQTPVSLQEQLNAQYKPAKMKSGFGGATVVEAGTVLAVQKGGVLSVPSAALTTCAAKFQDNKLHPSVGFCAAMFRNVSSYFQTGSKVYPLKLDVNLEKEKISFEVVACDSCNGGGSGSSMKGGVVFQFPKGYLETANAGAVEDTIGQVFAISSDDQNSDQNAAQNGGENQGEQQAQSGLQGGQPATQQRAEPQTIQLGQSTDQVLAALDKPDKIVNLGPKQIFVYRDLKVTFIDGKVSDVQ